MSTKHKKRYLIDNANRPAREGYTTLYDRLTNSWVVERNDLVNERRKELMPGAEGK